MERSKYRVIKQALQAQLLRNLMVTSEKGKINSRKEDLSNKTERKMVIRLNLHQETMVLIKI